MGGLAELRTSWVCGPLPTADQTGERGASGAHHVKIPAPRQCTVDAHPQLLALSGGHAHKGEKGEKGPTKNLHCTMHMHAAGCCSEGNDLEKKVLDAKKRGLSIVFPPEDVGNVC